MNIWRLSNTGVRNPFRIQDALRVYSQSNLVGKIRNKEQESKLGKYLAENGILDNENDKDGTYGRKFRFVWNKFGFTIGRVFCGQLDTITPFGEVFLKADTLPAVQECFLRSLSVHSEPIEPIAKPYEEGVFFSPLRWTLSILLEIEKQTGSSAVNFIEFAIFIQTSDPTMDVGGIVAEILDMRKRKELSTAKKVFDRKEYEKAKQQQGYAKKSGNYKEYADMNLRYLRATGLFQRKGRGIAIVPEKHSLAVKLASVQFAHLNFSEMYSQLHNIPELPTDHFEGAMDALNSVVIALRSMGIVCDISHEKLDTVAEINSTRLSLQQKLDKRNEEKYALEQGGKWEEISDYMELVMKPGRSKQYEDGNEISVPKDEAPAYLEWVIWRSFLAIDSLVNKPNEVRSFNVDQDFFPVNTAGGGKSDLIAEFSDYIICGEVTLSGGSRQEAMEGEPVRRHVADVAEKYKDRKKVLGLFIANAINTNTAETFRHGIWYLKDDIKMDLKIVPLTLSQYRKVFRHMFENNDNSPNTLIDLILRCEVSRSGQSAPQWKANIERIVNDYVNGKNNKTVNTENEMEQKV